MVVNIVVAILALFLVLGFAACASRGTKGSRRERVEFYLPGPITLPVGDVILNKASGKKSDPVIYHSSDQSVATISVEGVVEAIGIGTAKISAWHLGDYRQSDAIADYDVEVVEKAPWEMAPLTRDLIDGPCRDPNGRGARTIR